MDKKEYSRKYYQEHKEEILQRNKEWREKNKKKFNEILYRERRKKAEELKKQGVMYAWRTKAERERLYRKRNERINRRNKEKENINNDGK